jgi:ArsR family transcriptional regulator, arsenate/arsenite/antimonite-responsive transcriptional repressor
MVSTVKRRPASQDPDVRLFAALADPARLAIVRQLGGEGKVCACDFTACCDISQPTVSHHLKVLREAGVVASERRGTWVYYWLTESAITRLQALAGSLAARPALARMDAGVASGRALPVFD